MVMIATDNHTLLCVSEVAIAVSASLDLYAYCRLLKFITPVSTSLTPLHEIEAGYKKMDPCILAAMGAASAM